MSEQKRRVAPPGSPRNVPRKGAQPLRRAAVAEPEVVMVLDKATPAGGGAPVQKRSVPAQPAVAATARKLAEQRRQAAAEAPGGRKPVAPVGRVASQRKRVPQKQAQPQQARQKQAPQKQAQPQQAPQKQARQKQAPQKQAQPQQAPQKQVRQKQAPQQTGAEQKAVKQRPPQRPVTPPQPAVAAKPAAASVSISRTEQRQAKKEAARQERQLAKKTKQQERQQAKEAKQRERQQAKEQRSEARALRKAGADGLFMRITPRRHDLVSDIRSTILNQSPAGGRVIIWLVFLFCLCFLTWAALCQVDEVTRAMGKVIPSGKIRKVQHYEGGIIKKILVHEGDLVKKGQVLLEIDKTRFASSYRKSRSNVLALKARIARLEAEVSGKKFVVPKEVASEKAAIGTREQELYRSRMRAFDNSQQILKEQLSQRRQGLSEQRAKLTELRRSYKLLRKEVRMNEPLVAQGAVSEVEVLRLERQASQMKGEITGCELAIPKLQSQITEAKKAIEEGRLNFINQSRQELNAAYADLESLSSTSVALEDQLNRTSVVSPVTGRVNQLLVNTVGGIIQPGMDLVEIVPLEDTLLIEAQVRPQDIGFVNPDQKAMVKVLSYDFTIYGGLTAKLEHISSDTITDEHGNAFYKVILRTDKNYLGTESDPHLIMPGMPVTVDIISGKKSILSYLAKPLLRAKQEALRER